MTGVFLDMSKAFDKVWHKGLLFKLKPCRVEVDLLSLLECYLRDRKQRVLLNDQTSGWRKVNPGVSQGTVLATSNEVIFSWKSSTVLYPPVIFSNNSIIKW